MNRTRRVHIDEKLSGYFDSLVQKRCTFEIGLLVGHTLCRTNQNDFIQTAVEIPSETEEETSSLNDISPEWVHEISKQVDRLLPGGFSILGLYVVSSDPSRSVFDKCSFFISSLMETLAFSRLLAIPSSILSILEKEDFLHVVHICPQSNKTSVKTFFHQTDAKKAEILPAEIKLNVKSSGLVKFETSILLNELIYLSPALSSSCCMTPSDIIEERIKEMVTQLDSFAKKVVNAIGIFRGGTSDHKEIKLLTSSFSSTIVFNEENKKIPTKINGLIKCLAYVPREDEKNLDKIVKFLKQDFFKSFGTRLELLVEKWCEEIQDAEEDQREIENLSYGGDALLLMPNDTNQKQSISTNVTKSIRLPHRVVFPWIGLSTQDKEDDVKKKDRNTLGFDLSLLVFDDNDLSNCIQTTLELLGQHSTSDHLIQSSIVYLEKKSPSTSLSSSPNGGPSTNPHLSQNSIRDTDNFIGIHNKTTAVSSTLNTGLMYALFALLMLIIAVLVNFSTYN